MASIHSILEWCRIWSAALPKKRNREVLLASILETLCLMANLAISSGHHLKTVSQQQCTLFSTKKYSQLAVSHHVYTMFLLHCHPLTTNCWIVIYLAWEWWRGNQTAWKGAVEESLREIELRKVNVSRETHEAGCYVVVCWERCWIPRR